MRSVASGTGAEGTETNRAWSLTAGAGGGGTSVPAGRGIAVVSTGEIFSGVVAGAAGPSACAERTASDKLIPEELPDGGVGFWPCALSTPRSSSEKIQFFVGMVILMLRSSNESIASKMRSTPEISMCSFNGLPFEVTDPLGFPRPIREENVFGSRLEVFAENLMPAPSGFLIHFHHELFWPYAQLVSSALQRRETGWEAPRLAVDPPRYCFIRDGVPTRIPSDLRGELPPAPAVTLEQVLAFFDMNHAWAEPLQLLDLLTLVLEDLGPARFAVVTANHPWVAEFMR